jgi:hypothetical protein
MPRARISLFGSGVDANVRGARCFWGKVDDGLDGPRDTPFEGAVVHALVYVDSVFSGDHILQRRASLTAGLVTKKLSFASIGCYGD